MRVGMRVDETILSGTANMWLGMSWAVVVVVP